MSQDEPRSDHVCSREQVQRTLKPAADSDLVERVGAAIMRVWDEPHEVLSMPDMARAAIAEVQRWRDIKTAPDDGTEVLLWIEDLGVRPAAYVEGRWESPVDGSVAYDDPTHWMDQPAPPQEDGE